MNRKFETCWDVAKWIEGNVPYYANIGHISPIHAALWWHATECADALRDLSGRELAEALQDGIPAVTTASLDKRLEDTYEDTIELSKSYAEVDEEIEQDLRDFFLSGERKA